MLFNSVAFFVFFAIAYALPLPPNHKPQKHVLLVVAGLVFDAGLDRLSFCKARRRQPAGEPTKRAAVAYA